MAITIDVTPKNTTISPTEGVTTTLDITTSIPTISSFRPLINAIDVGGDGSLTYNSSDGNFTYTGPSATEVRAHLSAGTGVSYSSGQFSIGQDVATNATPTFTSTTVAQSNIRNGAAPYLNFYNAKNIAGGLSTSSTEFTGVIPFYGIAIDTDNSDAESYKPAARIFTKFSNCTESALAGQMVFEVTKAGATNWSMAGPNPKNVMVLDPGTVTIGVSGTSNALDLTDLVVNGSLDINGNADISGNLTGVDTLTATNLVGTLATANRNEIFSNVSGDITIAAGGAATIQATSVENSMLAGSITNAKLSNSTITVSDGSNTSPVALGGTLSFTGTSNEVTVAENAGTVTIGLPDDVTVGGDLVVTGDLTVNGTETILNSTTLTVDDKNIVLGNVDTPTDTTADGGGITLKGTTDKTLNWVDSTDSWTSSEHFELASTKTFRINANEVLNQTTLGSTVLASSLTSVGALDSGSITSNFSDIDIGDNVVTAAEFVGDLRGAVRFQAKAGESLAKGDVVYISGVSGQKPVVSKAQANSAATMPSFGLANAAVSANANIEVISFGTFAHGNTTGGAEEWEFGDILYVSAATAGALTNVKPAGAANLIQNVGKVERVHASSGSIMVAGAGRTAATPNLDTGKFFIGDSNNYSTTGSFNNQFTNTSGTISLNGANITTVGTIGTGTWQGTAIANDYIGNHSAAKLTSGTIDNARLPSAATSITSVGTLSNLVIQPPVGSTGGILVTSEGGSASFLLQGVGSVGDADYVAPGNFNVLGAASATIISDSNTIVGPTTVNSDLFEIKSTVDDATEKPIISLYRDAGVPSTNDELGAIRWFGQNASDEKQFYGGIYAQADVITDGAHKGSLNFHLADGSNNGTAISDVLVDINGDEDPAMSLTSELLTLNAGLIVNNDSMEIVSTEAGADAMPIISLFKNGGSTTDGDDLGGIRFYGMNDHSTPKKTFYAGMYGELGRGDHGDEIGRIKWHLADGSGTEDAVTDVTATITGDSDPTMTLEYFALNLKNDVNINFQAGGGTNYVAWDTGNNHTKLSADMTQDAAIVCTLPTVSGTLAVTNAETFTGGVTVEGGLNVSGGITSDSFTYSRAVALQDGNLSASQYLALAGKRIIQSGSTDPTYTLFQPVAADVGKSWIICNPSTKNITIDPDTQNVWILDGVTLTARESSWYIKKGGVAEIVCIASHATGGGVTQANFVIFGAGVIEL